MFKLFVITRTWISGTAIAIHTNTIEFQYRSEAEKAAENLTQEIDEKNLTIIVYRLYEKESSS